MLFANARVFDGTGRAPFRGEVLVKDNRIAAVGEADALPRGNPGAAAQDSARQFGEVVDCAGATLMPGMVEAHAHLSWPSSVGRIFDAMVLPPEEHLLVTARNARVTLEAGFTSAYSAGSLGPRFEIALREEIDGGWLPGPRLRASSLERLPEGALGLKDQSQARNADALRGYVREMAKAGADSIKFLLSSDDAFTPGGSHKLTYSEEEVAAIGDEARKSGVYLACHAQAAEAVKRAAKSGFRIVYHCSHADEEALDLLEAKKDEIFVAPAIGLIYTRAHEAENWGIKRGTEKDMGAPAQLERMQKLYPKMRKRGIRVLPGGDYGFPYNPIGTNARDLQWFVEILGYTPAEALVAATRFGGELMGRGDKLGLIKEGYLADLLVVDGDPTRDVKVLQDASRLALIMKDGKVHKRTARLSS